MSVLGEEVDPSGQEFFETFALEWTETAAAEDRPQMVGGEMQSLAAIYPGSCSMISPTQTHWPGEMAANAGLLVKYSLHLPCHTPEDWDVLASTKGFRPEDSRPVISILVTASTCCHSFAKV